MGEHIVHLPRDPVALHLSGLGYAELLFGRRPFALDEGELTPCPDEHPQREHRYDTDDAQHALPPIRWRHVGPDQQREEGRQCVAGCNEHSRTEASVHRDGEQGDQRDGGGTHRVDGEQADDDRQSDRPAPTQPQPETGQHAESGVHRGGHRWKVPLGGVDVDERRESDAQQETQCVDGPIARCASRALGLIRLGDGIAEHTGGRPDLHDQDNTAARVWRHPTKVLPGVRTEVC
jgi:hypothetical protein